MNESFDQANKKIEIVKSVEKKQEYKFLGNLNRKKGLKLFGVSNEGKIYEVEINNKKTFDMSKNNSKLEAIINPNDYYLWALNEKSAMKKYISIMKRIIAKYKKQ